MKVAEPTTSIPAEGPAAGTRGIGSRGLPAIVIVTGGLLITMCYQAGRWLQARGHRMQVNAPPLTGNVDLTTPPRALAAVALGALGVWRADDIAGRTPWRRLLWLSFLGALAWSAALAWWDGSAGFTRSVTSGVDYLGALPFMADAPGAFLRGFVAGIDRLPSHVRAHPPGLVLTIWAMGRAGMTGAPWVAALEHVAGAASVPAILLSARELGGTELARRSAPFLVFAPVAVFWSSGDAVFLGVGTWAAALLILATGREGRRSDGLALASGLLAGFGLFLSYGLVLLGVIPLVVAIRRRRLLPLLLAGVPVLVWFATLAWAGFWWFDGLQATRREYAESVARLRPYWYFVVANLAALAVAVGPAVWVAVTRLRDRAVWIVTGAALLAIVVADVSGLSKAEVERIWLPFMPWLLVAVGATLRSAVARKGWLSLQVVWAILLQMVVRSPW